MACRAAGAEHGGDSRRTASGPDEQEAYMTAALAKTSGAAALAIGVVLALGGASTARAGDGRSDSQARQLEGTWRVRVTSRDCASGTPLMSFAAMLTFAQGGTMTGTTSALLFRPGQRSSDHGVWTRTHGNEYSAVSEAFILFDSPAPPLPLRRGTQRIAQAITMDGDDAFASDAAVEFRDEAGSVVLSLCATAEGSRFN
jgi:hypothetical protein